MLYILIIVISLILGFLIGWVSVKYLKSNILGNIVKKDASEKITSGRVATKASEILRGRGNFNDKAKSVAGSALSQSRHHKKNKERHKK